MLFAESVHKSVGALEALRGVSFTLAKGEKADLVRPNGAGKTTILRIVAGDDEPDEGHAGRKGAEGLGYLRQEAGLEPQYTLLEELWTAFPEAQRRSFRRITLSGAEAAP